MKIKYICNKNYSSSAELIVHRHAEVESTRIGLKRTNNECSAAEQEELENAYGNYICLQKIFILNEG